MASFASLGQLLVVLTTPVLARLYLPADFGVMGVFNSVASFFGGLACLRYEQAVPLTETEEDTQNLVALGALCCLLSGIVLSSGFYLFAGQLAQYPSFRLLQPYLSLVLVAVVLNGLLILVEMWWVRLSQFAWLGVTKLLQSITVIGLQMTLWRSASLGLVCSQMGGLTVAIGFCLLFSLRFRLRIGLSRIRSLGRRFIRFPLYGLYSSFALAVAFQFPLLLLANFYGEEVAGYYAFGQRVVSLPALLLAESLARAFLAESAKLWREDLSSLRHLFARTLRIQVLCALVFMAGVVITAPWVFSNVLGAAWTEAGEYSRLLALGAGCAFVALPFEPLVDVAERQPIAAGRDILRALLFTLPVYFCARAGAGARDAVWALSVGAAAYALLSLSISAYCLARADSMRASSRLSG